MDDRHQAFASGLTRQERLLLELRDLFYDGAWDGLRKDLEARQKRKPFIIKLNTRVEADLEFIAKLQAYEEEHKINLRHFLPPLT